MNTDARPRNGGSGRRRRGGRNRRNEHPRHGHGQPTTRHTKEEKNPIKKLLSWIFKRKPAKSADGAASRPPVTERRERAERPPRDVAAAAEPVTPQEITSPKLYVGNLSYDAAESDLFDLFSKVGAVKNVEVVMDRNNNRSKGFGFVEMEALETAKVAAEKLNRTEFMGRQIVVSGAKTDRRAA